MVSQPQTPPPFGDKNASAGVLATGILLTVLYLVLVTLRFVNPNMDSQKGWLG